MHNPLFIRMLRLKMENKAHPTLTCDQAFFLFGEERNWAKKKGRRLPDHRFILRTRLRLKFWGEHCFFYQCQHEKIISTRNAVNVWLNISKHCSPSTSKLTPHKDVLRALSRIPSPRWGGRRDDPKECLCGRQPHRYPPQHMR